MMKFERSRLSIVGLGDNGQVPQRKNAYSLNLLNMK
jgi:hypothetical protein